MERLDGLALVPQPGELTDPDWSPGKDQDRDVLMWSLHGGQKGAREARAEQQLEAR